MQIYDIKEEIEDKTLRYPEYYIKSFHAYDQGNLDWTAAFEVELATLSMGMRTFKDEDLSPEEAQDKLRAGPMKSLQVNQHINSRFSYTQNAWLRFLESYRLCAA